MEFSVTLPRTTEFTLNATASLLNFSMVGLTGPSGAGKTSLFRALAGLEKDAQIQSRFRQGALNRHRVGMVFQEPLLLPHLTVAGNLQLATRYKASKRSVQQDDEAIIAGCHCQHLLARSPSALSGGEAQRVALARALLNQPELLLLDEPLSAVDQSTRASIMQWLRQVAEQGLPMILISHDISDLWLYCQSLLLMQDGEIVRHDVPSEVIHAMYQQSADSRVRHVAILSGPVRMGDTNDMWTEFECEAQPLYTCRHAAGDAKATLSVAAHTVVIDKDGQVPTSLDNQFMCEVQSIGQPCNGEITVSLQRGSARLYATISAAAVSRLHLRIGDTVRASFPA
ncbi:ATP-binding cassette domain-containing protein [Salinimonas sp. HHU 13199]|uniref:ATP-binding cassette domain-containing protein n=1 Tax=Salinimonas profundi TaxID=2729140 RepID=A0ABR8LH04_9ALTE|nr:ATP-binding cassette domain-containing protein [Salinimonas profundi]MBD3584246.1 ATP-binding cassette domain-containing protein [Salinimonas profundi]